MEDIKPRERNEIVKMLVEEVNSDVNFKHSKSKLTPLHWASKVKQDPETV